MRYYCTGPASRGKRCTAVVTEHPREGFGTVVREKGRRRMVTRGNVRVKYQFPILSQMAVGHLITFLHV